MNKSISKLIAFFLAVVLVFAMSPAFISNADSVIASGTCGDNLTWSFSGRVLKISGYGDMYNWDNGDAVPWSEFRASIAFVRFPDGLTSIGDHAFYNCNNLNDFDLPDTLSYIGSAAFYGCESITEVDIPYGASSIGYCAFQRCKSLKVIDMPETVIKIGYGAFRECESLLKLNIPNGVSTIAQDTFAGCKSLYSINFPDNLTVIGSYAFDDCPNLTAIWLPEAVTYIGTNPFSGCDGLKDIYFAGSRAQFVKIEGYTEIDESITIHYAKETPLKITSQPKDYVGSVGNTAKFKVVAEGTELKYQWQTNSSGKWVNSSLPGAKTAELSVPVTLPRNGYKFRCVVKDYANKTVKSNIVTLKVSIVSASINTQPKDFTGKVGTTATFKVSAQGTGLKYQWQTYSGGKWVNSSLTGNKTATLSVPITNARNGYKFRCVVTDCADNSVTSKVVTLHAETIPASITTQPKDYTGKVGTTASFKVVAQGTGLKYQWQTHKSGAWVNSSLKGSKTNTLSVDVTKARDGYKFRCVITDSGNKTVTSKSVVLRVSS